MVTRSILALHHLLSSLLIAPNNPFFRVGAPSTAVAFSPTRSTTRRSRKSSVSSRTTTPAIERMAIEGEGEVRGPSTSKSNVAATFSWRSGTDPLRLDPSALSKEGGEDCERRPRLAKDEDYAAAVTKAWGDEITARAKQTSDSDALSSSSSSSFASLFTYECKTDGSLLYGHVYRPSPPPSDPSAKSSPPPMSMPGVVLFHTGAGPQDVFLRWKADSLVTDRKTFGENGCVVLVADILGDPTGWAWSGDRRRYQKVRSSVLVPHEEHGTREALAGRVRAAIEAARSQPGVDPKRIAALGFCLGGHPVLELARLRDPGVKAMATFHGVFDGVRRLSPVEGVGGDGGDGGGGGNVVAGCDVLVCTGADDPFVLDEDLHAATDMFKGLGYRTDVMKFPGTRHGFTNPAQDFNPSEAFAYSEDSYKKAWSAALSLLKRV